MLQGDTIFDMVESSDVDVVKSNLDTENNSSSGDLRHQNFCICVNIELAGVCCWRSIKQKRRLSSERSFICSMQTSKAFKLQHGNCCSMMVKGSFRTFPEPCPSSSSACRSDQPLFVALCTPTVDRVRSNDSHLCHSFNSVHSLDMTFVHLSDRYIQRSPPQAENKKSSSY